MTCNAQNPIKKKWVSVWQMASVPLFLFLIFCYLFNPNKPKFQVRSSTTIFPSAFFQCIQFILPLISAASHMSSYQVLPGFALLLFPVCLASYTFLSICIRPLYLYVDTISVVPTEFTTMGGILVLCHFFFISSNFSFNSSVLFSLR